MILTSSNKEYLSDTVANAQSNVKLWENNLAFRISLQQLTDTFNQFPVIPSSFKTSDLNEFNDNELKNDLKDILTETSSLLLMQTKENRGEENVKFDHCPSWEELIEVQNSLEEEWEEIINKWHARTHFGSEKKKSSLKVFNQTLWDQVSFDCFDLISFSDCSDFFDWLFGCRLMRYSKMIHELLRNLVFQRENPKEDDYLSIKMPQMKKKQPPQQKAMRAQVILKENTIQKFMMTDHSILFF